MPWKGSRFDWSEDLPALAVEAIRSCTRDAYALRDAAACRREAADSHVVFSDPTLLPPPAKAPPRACR